MSKQVGTKKPKKKSPSLPAIFTGKQALDAAEKRLSRLEKIRKGWSTIMNASMAARGGVFDLIEEQKDLIKLIKTKKAGSQFIEIIGDPVNVDE